MRTPDQHAEDLYDDILEILKQKKSIENTAKEISLLTIDLMITFSMEDEIDFLREIEKKIENL